MESIIIEYHNTSFGELILGDYKGELCLCNWRSKKTRERVDNRLKRYFKSDFREGSSDTLEATKEFLKNYEQGSPIDFNTPITLGGTDFQKSVWSELLKIPYGKTVNYQYIANAIQKPKGVRAVANAIGANAMSIIVPCHRVIGSNGSLTGYAGGLSTKEKLLLREGSIF